jgi:hypothetical protein
MTRFIAAFMANSARSSGGKSKTFADGLIMRHRISQQSHYIALRPEKWFCHLCGLGPGESKEGTMNRAPTQDGRCSLLVAEGFHGVGGGGAAGWDEAG